MIKLSFLNLFRRKSRTVLAVLGIVIGVAAIMVMVSVVDGIYKEINEMMGQYQGIIVMEKDAIDVPFSHIDESFESKLESIQNVHVAVPEIYFMPSTIDGKTPSSDEFMPVTVYAPNVQKYRQMRGSGWIVNVARGKMLSGNDYGYVMLGNKLADDYHKFIGSSIKVNGKKFKVKGIFEASSEFIENVIVMNLKDARDVTGFPDGKISSFTLDLIDPSKDKHTAELINFKFGDKLDAATMSDYSEQVGSMLDNFRLVTFFVAAISAFVAGIGIANTILMSVMERSREIGALKAVGWTNGNVMKMILYESMFIGMLGGTIGVILGFVGARYLEATFGLTTVVSVSLIAQAFAFALFIGLFAGVYPAIRAAKLVPVEAIRGG